MRRKSVGLALAHHARRLASSCVAFRHRHYLFTCLSSHLDPKCFQVKYLCLPYGLLLLADVCRSLILSVVSCVARNVGQKHDHPAQDQRGQIVLQSGKCLFGVVSFRNSQQGERQVVRGWVSSCSGFLPKILQTSVSTAQDVFFLVRSFILCSLNNSKNCDGIIYILLKCGLGCTLT